jgi:hypothetical protein
MMTKVPRGAPLGPRLRRLLHRKSIRPVAFGARRALEANRVERDVRRAARDGRPVVLGPFVDEVGFEVLYWIPMVHRLLTEHGIPPDRVTAFSRGGAAAWYRSFASGELEILDVVEPAAIREELLGRRAAAGHSKQLRIGALDRSVLAAAGVEDAAVLHPIVMYRRLRFIWDGLQPLSDLAHQARYELLPVPDLPPEFRLPEAYVAVKPYFNSCFPDTAENRAFLAKLVTALAEHSDVVLLSIELDIDDHVEWAGGGDAPVHRLPGLNPSRNLEVQAAVVARATRLVSTYGGFSYLGPFLGVPTLAFRSSDDFNHVHLEALRAALPDAVYEAVTRDDALERARGAVVVARP